MNEESVKRQKVILFDGVCNLCNGSVRFVLQREKSQSFQFASIQSETGKELLRECGLPSGYDQAVVFIDGGTFYLGSTAALKIGQGLKSPWSVLSSLGFVVPRFLRAWVYRQVAKHRYGWFGKREIYIVPTETLKSRFI